MQSLDNIGSDSEAYIELLGIAQLNLVGLIAQSIKTEKLAKAIGARKGRETKERDSSK